MQENVKDTCLLLEPPPWPSGQGVSLESDRPGFDSHFRRGSFLRVESYGDFTTGTPVAILLGAWRCRVSAETGWPGVSTLWLGEIENLTWNFCLRVAVRTIVSVGPSLRYTGLLQGS